MRPLDFLVAGVLLAGPVGLIIKQPDLGTSMLVLAAGLSVIFFAGLSWKLVLPPLLIAVIGVVLVVLYEPRLCADGMRWVVLHDYQQQRICTLLDPTRDPLGRGFHIIQGMIAIGSGGVYGKGFMQGTQTHLEFIPERTTDFIFAAYSEEFGLLGNLLLIAAFLFLVLRGLLIARDATTLFTRLLAGAMTMILFAYAFVNMGMVSGILPVVGVPLPFISYGGTAMVTLGMALGILMSISRAQRLGAAAGDQLRGGALQQLAPGDPRALTPTHGALGGTADCRCPGADRQRSEAIPASRWANRLQGRQASASEARIAVSNRIPTISKKE